jgi:hypothetical protein
MCCVKVVQQTVYAQEIEDLTKRQAVSTTTNLKALHPFFEQTGILRVGGLLQQSTLPYHMIHQILPANHHFTKLIMSAEHVRLLHAGPPTTDSITMGKLLDTMH